LSERGAWGEFGDASPGLGGFAGAADAFESQGTLGEDGSVVWCQRKGAFEQREGLREVTGGDLE
jgi:hypothetical protein